MQVAETTRAVKLHLYSEILKGSCVLETDGNEVQVRRERELVCCIPVRFIVGVGLVAIGGLSKLVEMSYLVLIVSE